MLWLIEFLRNARHPCCWGQSLLRICEFHEKSKKKKKGNGYKGKNSHVQSVQWIIQEEPRRKEGRVGVGFMLAREISLAGAVYPTITFIHPLDTITTLYQPVLYIETVFYWLYGHMRQLELIRSLLRVISPFVMLHKWLSAMALPWKVFL